MQKEEPVFDYELAVEAVKTYLRRFCDLELEGPDLIASAAYYTSLYIYQIEQDGCELADYVLGQKNFQDLANQLNNELLTLELEKLRSENIRLKKRLKVFSDGLCSDLN